MSQRLGVIGRADRGGLAAQTFEVANHCDVDAVLLLDLGTAGRSNFEPEPWFQICDQVHITSGHPTSADVDWLVERCDSVYTAECPYDEFTIPELCDRLDKRYFIHANPELFSESYVTPKSVVLAPTSWRLDLLPVGALDWPMPVDMPLNVRRNIPMRTFLHVTQPAMLDRAGTDALLDALLYMEEPFRLRVAGPRAGEVAARAVDLPRVLDVEVVRSVRDRWEIYEGSDVLVAPRRYGGLSLLMQEAAALGMPIVALDCEPQQHWQLPGLVPARRPYPYTMKGGSVDVWDCDPAELAWAMTRLVQDAEWAEHCSDAAGRWASTISWFARAPEWLGLFGKQLTPAEAGARAALQAD